METSLSTGQESYYRKALRSLRAIKNWFAWLLLLALLIDAAAIATARLWPTFTQSRSLQMDLARMAKSAEAQGAATRPAATQPMQKKAQVVVEGGKLTPAEPTTQPAAGFLKDPAAQAESAYALMTALLPFAMSMGLIFALLLIGIEIVSLIVIVVGRIGDSGRMSGALGWSFVLAALFVPWNLAFGPMFMSGVTMLRPELIRGTATVAWGAHPTWNDNVLYYVRFVAYPVIVFLLWLLVQLKTRAAMRQPRVRVD